MDRSNDTLLICGNFTRITRKFDEQTKIEQVREYVRQSFHESLPKSYRIVYYDPMTMSFVNLENQLRNGLNPFQVNSSIGAQSTTSTTNCIHLYVVSNIHPQIEDDQIVSDGVDDEIHNESSLSENSLSTTDDISQDTSTTNEDRSLMIIPHYIKLEETQSISNRLTFSLDVKSNQRDIYKSDQFSIRAEKPNGRIARVQGIKNENKKMLQVLPRLRIPLTYFQSNVTLVVAVVSEQLNNGMRIWYKHPHKGFLPEGYTKDTKSINPITFDLNKTHLTADGDFILSLQMVTKWNKSQTEREEFYRFDNRQTVLVHRAEHDENSPRLFCVVQRNGVTDWNSFCLSDFIRSPKSSRQRSSSVTTERTCSPERKRSKTNN